MISINSNRHASCVSVLAGIFWAFAAQAQISPSAYRVLGQTNANNNGLNMVQGVELNSPNGVALDTRGAQAHLYIADTTNSRVLAWQDVSSYQVGDPPALILGQPGPQYSGAFGIGAKGFNAPIGLAVDSTTGNLYVADFGDNRVLRFRSPFDNPGQVAPDAVYGQPNFTTFAAGNTSAASMKQPRSVAVDSLGNLWVSDSGNSRILRFSAPILNNQAPVSADLVIGQNDFVSSQADAGGAVSSSGLDTPSGLAVDAQNNLYVADTNNTRVLRYSAPIAANNPPASAVWGETNFTAHGVPQQPSNMSMAGPVGIAVDANRNLYVATPRDNRVLVFAKASGSGSGAVNVFGQTDFTTTTANLAVFPQASPSTLSGPSDVKVDAGGNVFIADAANNRVIKIPAGSKSANQVWGQTDFTSNGPNQVKPSSINFPYHMAIDYSQAPYALYVSDTGNNRVLVWRDSVRFQNGDPADLVIGQPNLRIAVANADTGSAQTPTNTSLSAPTGIAVNPNDGTLYVADSGNNRLLRFPRPVSQPGRIAADAVIGQPNFTSGVQNIVSASSLSSPGGVAVGPNGQIFVADTLNNRVLEFAPGASTGASAVRVYGQPGMNSSVKPSQPSVQTLSAPQGICVDQASNLYVVDTAANRALIFSNTPTAPPAGAAATFVIGQGNFNGGAGGTALKAPLDIAVNSSGQIYISDTGNNRVLYFPSLILLPIAGSTATGVVGQAGLGGTSANWDGQNGLASADSFYGPAGVYIDRQDTLYVGDAGNNRVLHFLKLGVVVNAATFQTGIPVAPGSIATIGGGAVATTVGQATGTTWPASLVNRQVVFNDQVPSPLYFVGQNQINFQVPSNAALGLNRVAVRLADTNELVAGGSVVITTAAPGLFTLTQNGAGQVAALNQDYSVNGPANPAAAGSTIQLFGTGQGPVSPAVPDGTAAPSGQLSNTVAVPTADQNSCLNTQPSVCVAVGSNFGTIQYSGLAPGFIGLWQINVVIPKGTPSGNIALRVVIDGVPSNQVSIAVR
jgi:uncharacterized protein (TIGR03437 family)